MSRLVNPVTGTVVHCEGDLEAAYRARGWAEPEAARPVAEVAPEKPRRGRPPKKATDDS